MFSMFVVGCVGLAIWGIVELFRWLIRLLF